MSDFTLEELQLATRNHGLPLEGLRYPITPIGLHYVLSHFDIPVVDGETWRLEVDGCVDRPIRVSLEELKALPAATLPVTFECAGNGRGFFVPRPASQPWLHEAVGTGEWTGPTLRVVLATAKVSDAALEVVFTGIDRGVDGGVEQQYERSLPLAEAMRDDVLLAHSLNGVPLPPQHGFPLRLVIPGWYGMTNVKWLTRIRAVAEPFAGQQQAQAYRLRSGETDPGVPLQLMRPRALMIPPGIPDFFTRRRIVGLGPVQIEGRTWSGFSPVESVAFSSDGRQWLAAHLDPAEAPTAWRRWHLSWEPPRAGLYKLRCRARDASGAEQPDAPEWNAGGYANNAVQVVEVMVREAAH